MKVGLHYGATDESMPLLEVAGAAQARGLASIFLPEHTHIPSARRTPFPGGGEIPRRYLRVFDPLTALAMIAARTDLVVGTCVALIGEHDPIAYAKATATLDYLSNGRLVLGVGFGWNDEEFESHGYSAKDKYSVVTEKLQLMKAIWTQDEASFVGRHVRLEPSWSWPKPVQRPHPPVLLGGRATAKTFERIAAWADGWIPMTMEPAATFDDDVGRLREVWLAAGRPLDSLQVVVMQAPLQTGELADRFDFFADRGVRHVLVDLPTEPAEVIVPLLDAITSALPSD